jgi:hypothetical protein
VADTTSRLTFVLDENSGSLPTLLRESRGAAYGDVTTLSELGIAAGTLDPELFRRLGNHGACVLVTRDGRMLEPVEQREAWHAAGVTLFLLGQRWGTLKLGDLARRFLFIWPALVDQAYASAPGAAWRVNPSVPSTPTNAFRLVSGRHADPAAG